MSDVSQVGATSLPGRAKRQLLVKAPIDARDRLEWRPPGDVPEPAAPEEEPPPEPETPSLPPAEEPPGPREVPRPVPE
jgi:hypothetical protein